MQMKESHNFPEADEIFWDVNQTSRGDLSVCVGGDLKPVYKALLKRYGAPFCAYYDMFDDGRILAWEWLIPGGVASVGKIKRLLKPL